MTRRRGRIRPAITSPNGAMLRSNNWRRHTHWNKALKKIDCDLYSDELDQVATNLDHLHATEIHTPKTGQEPDHEN